MTMPETDAPRKPPRRFWLFAPYVLVLIAFAIWSGYWVYGRGQLLAALDAAAAPDQGHSLTYAAREVGGYPFRFVVKLDQPKLTERSGWGLSAPDIEVQAAAYNPRHMVAVASHGVVLTRPGKGAVAISGEVLRASIANLDTRPRISIEGRKLAIAAAEGGQPMPFSTLDVFQMHVRSDKDHSAKFFVGLEGAVATPGSLMSRVTDAKTNLRLEAVLTSANMLKGADWPGLLQHWAAANGEMRIGRAEAQVGEAVLSATDSDLRVDGEGRLHGKLDLRLRKGPDAMMALGATGVLPPETAAVAAGLAGKEAHIELSFAGGQARIGPFPIGRAPKLY